MFKALLINKNETAQSVSITDIDESQLPEAAVTVKVEYSTINYKDGLAITGKSPVVRKFPMVPGIDFAGVVESSTSDQWKAGDRVVLNGWGVGEGHWGGLAQKARVKAEWLIALPSAFSAKQAMARPSQRDKRAVMRISVVHAAGVHRLGVRGARSKTHRVAARQHAGRVHHDDATILPRCGRAPPLLAGEKRAAGV